VGILSDNIRHLRKLRGLTQEELANNIKIKRAVIGAYEEGRAEPKIQTLQNLAQFFSVTIDSLLNSELSKSQDKIKVDIEGGGFTNTEYLG
jgi:transcriptional regulator with XRE-family HTH domain